MFILYAHLLHFCNMFRRHVHHHQAELLCHSRLFIRIKKWKSFERR